MAQISRPFQIAFVGIVLLAGVWLFALKGHSSSNNSSSASSSPPASAPSTSAAAEEKAAAASTSTYHGAAPGVSGLTGAIAKAHGAVATSQQNAHQLESASAAAGSSSAAGSGTSSSSASAGASHTAATSDPATTAATSTHVTRKTTHAAATTVTKTTVTKKSGTTTKTATRTTVSTNSRQRQVEAQLAAGDVVLILFWNPHGSDDVADSKAVRAVASAHTKVQLASSGEVASFGSITRGVQVYGTPTILVVAKGGKTSTVTGLTDPYALKQAIGEARKG
jgi:hypothetical protein